MCHLLIKTKATFELGVGIYLIDTNSDSATWSVIVNTFAPSAGEYIIYEGTFSDFEEAEIKAWEEAQAVLKDSK